MEIRVRVVIARKLVAPPGQRAQHPQRVARQAQEAAAEHAELARLGVVREAHVRGDLAPVRADHFQPQQSHAVRPPPCRRRWIGLWISFSSVFLA